MGALWPLDWVTHSMANGAPAWLIAVPCRQPEGLHDSASHEPRLRDLSLDAKCDLLTRMVGEPRKELTALILEALKRDLPTEYSWPGNVRELEQAVRRILLTGTYKGDDLSVSQSGYLGIGMEEGRIDAQTVLALYCRLLYDRHGTFEEVARITRLDRRTVKKYLQHAGNVSV